MTLSMWRIR